jgi:cytochrome c biogenesis protein CcdA
MSTEQITDVDGKESSKRKTGIKLVNVGLGMALIYFLIGIGLAIFEKELKYSFPFDIWITIIMTGASLLGITVIERFQTKK